jgi:hypothetical protein
MKTTYTIAAMEARSHQPVATKKLAKSILVSRGAQKNFEAPKRIRPRAGFS